MREQQPGDREIGETGNGTSESEGDEVDGFKSRERVEAILFQSIREGGKKTCECARRGFRFQV